MSRKKASASASASSLVFPEERERETISRDTQVTIAGILESYNKKGEEFTWKDGTIYSLLTNPVYIGKKIGKGKETVEYKREIPYLEIKEAIVTIIFN